MMADNLVSTGVTEVRKSGTGRVRHDSVGGEEHVMGGHVYVTVARFYISTKHNNSDRIISN